MFTSPARAMKFVLLVVAALLLVSTPSHASMRKLKESRNLMVPVYGGDNETMYNVTVNETMENETMLDDNMTEYTVVVEEVDMPEEMEMPGVDMP
eukprot:gene17758-24120_t